VGRYSIAIKDFRVIRQAKVEPEGITLICGGNGMGKSSLGKALVTLLSNQHSEENFRHGKSMYAIGVRVGDNRLLYTRNGDTSSVKFNDEPARQKLGRVPMSQVEPRFPLKRFDYEDSSFFPNFSFQNEIPLFGDISIYSLFSSMFSSIAKVSERVTACQTDCRSLSKKREGSLASSEMLKEKVSESKKDLAGLEERYPNLESDYLEVKSLVERKRKIDAFMREYVSLSASCGDAGKQTMAALYDEAQPLFPAVMMVEKAGRVLTQLGVLEDSLKAVREELAAFPDILLKVNFSVLISEGLTLNRFEERLEKIQGEVVPDVPVVLLGGMARIQDMERELRFVRQGTPPNIPVSLVDNVGRVEILQMSLQVTQGELGLVLQNESAVQDQVKALPCERFADGLCPYSSKLSA
jgi:energy-coupling factor transporter ATP-binding protein EcfA2